MKILLHLAIELEYKNVLKKTNSEYRAYILYIIYRQVWKHLVPFKPNDQIHGKDDDKTFFKHLSFLHRYWKLDKLQYF